MELKSQPPEPQGFYFSHAWADDGERVASSVYGEYMLVVWDPDTGKELARTKTMDCLLYLPRFSPDGRYLAAGCIFVGGNSPVFIIDPNTGEILQQLPSQNGWSDVARWSPDGKTLAVGYQDGTVKLWDTDTWTVRRVYNLHQGIVWDLEWSNNGKRIISADCEYHFVYLWDVDTGDILMNWKFPIGELDEIDWSPDGQFISALGMTGMPVFRRVWQSTQELIDYAYECCVWRQLTPAERIQFGLPEKP